MKRRIVLINFCNGLFGGIESFLINIFRGLDKDEYEAHFLTCGETTYSMYRDDIESCGGFVEEIPINANTILKRLKLYKELLIYFRKSTPDIVHINSGGLSYHFIAGLAASRCGIKQIILHSHNFIPLKSGINYFLKKPIKKQIVKYGTHFLACSLGAAYWIFPKEIVEHGDVEIIPNGIDASYFRFDDNKRKSFRKELGITDELILGHIGRFQTQKNHEFLINVMRIVLTNIPNAKLLLVGEGELKEHIKGLIQEYGMDEHVIFLGERKDLDFFYSAIDIFLLPSLFEGFGIVAIEAQASGAKTILSSRVPKETNVTGEAVYLSIENQTERLWAQEIALNASSNKDVVWARKDEWHKVIKAGYDINELIDRMRKVYLT